MTDRFAMRRLCLVVLAIVGCGGDGGGSPFEGGWALTEPNGCLVGLTFRGDQYENDVICTLSTGGFGLQVDTGAFSWTPDRITLTPGMTTCPGHAAVTFGWTTGVDKLTIIATDGVLVFQRQPDSPGNAVAQFGCWMPDGFHLGPLLPTP